MNIKSQNRVLFSGPLETSDLRLQLVLRSRRSTWFLGMLCPRSIG